MKKTTKLFICLITALCVIAGISTSYASQSYLGADIAYNKTDSAKNTLKITAQVESSAAYVTLYVTDDDVKREDIIALSDISKIKIADAIPTIEGKVDVSYDLGQYLPFDKYNAYMFVSSDSFLSAQFTYLSPDAKLERDRQTILTALKTATDWKQFKEVFSGTDAHGKKINDNLSFINPDMDSYYNKISSSNDKASVFMRMFSNRKTLAAFEDIALSFYKESKYMFEHPSKSQGVSGGGSSGSSIGGSHGSSFTTDASASAPSSPSGYTDMSGHWAESYVNRLNEMKIVSGYPDGTFKPENSVTRAEFVKLISSAFSLPVSGDTVFWDVNDADWFAPFVRGAASVGVVTGSGGSFRPNDNITRQDASVILYRAISLKYNLEDGNVFFTDETDIASYASVAIRTLASQKIITGMTDGSFMPQSPTTRAQAATLILKAVDFMSIH